MPATVPSPADGGAAASTPPCRVLVTGAAGFLGAAVVRAAITAGHDVCAMVRPGGGRARLTGVPTRLEEADLCDPASLMRLVESLRPDVVVHAAVASGHARSAADRATAWDVNVRGTVHLLEALTESGHGLLVHIGAGTEYGPSDTPLHEDHSGVPLTVRGVTKRAAGLAVRQWAIETGRRAVVVRPFSIYGPGEQPDKLVPTLLRCAATGATFPMIDVVSRRDLVHVDDVAAGCLRAAAVADPAAPVINLGTGVEHSVDEVRRIVEAETGRPVTVATDARPAQRHDTPHWVADTTRCRALLGWIPPTTLHDGIHRLVRSAAVATVR